MDNARLSSEVKRAFASRRFNRSLDDVLAQPVGPRRARSWGLAGAAVLAGAMLWALSSAPIPGGPQFVFAGWQPEPMAPNAALSGAAAAACSPNGELSGMRMIAQDQRGNAAAFVFAGGSQLAICLVGENNSGAVVTAAAGSSRLAPATGALSVDSGLSVPKSSAADGLTIVAGRVSAAVSSVDIARDDGDSVAATVTGGYFVAWWPTADEVAEVVAKDDRGNAIGRTDRPF